jgi:tetratricopeptide (TPR) repeat protein
MHLTRTIRIILCIGFLLPVGNLFGQVDAARIESWIEKLSVRKDPVFKNYRFVLDELNTVDSAHYCNAVAQLVNRATDENIYCRIRAGYLRRTAIDNEFYRCAFSEESSPQPNPLHLAHSIEDPFLISLGNRLYAGYYRVKGDYGLALMHLLLAREAQDSLGTENYFDVAFDRYALGELQYHARDYENAIASILQALRFNEDARQQGEDTLQTSNLMFLYNTLGLAHDKAGQADSALAAFHKAILFAEQSDMAKQWVPMIKGNCGDVYYTLGQYDSAAVLIQQDITSSLEAGPKWADNAATSLNKLALIHNKRGESAKALGILRQANEVLKQNHRPRIQASIYHGFMEIFQALDNTDSLSYYTKQYLTLHDSLERRATESQAVIVNVRLENQLSIDHIKSLHREKRRIALIRNFSIVIAILSFAFGVLYFNRQRLKMTLQQQQTLELKKKAEAEAATAKQVLDIYTQHLLEKSAMVENLQEQLSSKQSDEEQAQTIWALSQHTIFNDTDWEQFKSLFEKVHPGFVDQIKSIAPDITSAELRVAVLSKLHLTPKEAGTILGISHASVNKTRQRLRQRLNLEQGADLEAYFRAPLSDRTA